MTHGHYQGLRMGQGGGGMVVGLLDNPLGLVRKKNRRLKLSRQL